MQLNIINSLLFLISPFLALPSIIVGVFKRNNYSILLFIICVSFISYLYLPSYSNDKTRYIEIYEDFKNWDILTFILYNLQISQDFILQLFVKIGSDVGVKVQWIFFFLMIIVFSVFLKLWKGICLAGNYSLRELILTFILVLTSFSLLDLFSGIRFVLASSIAVYAMYSIDKNMIFDKKIIFSRIFKGIILWLVAVNIHFSLWTFLICFLLVTFFNFKLKYYKMFFLISFLFLFLPKEILLNLFELLNLEGALQDKATAYLSDEDFTTNYLKEAGGAGIIIQYVQSIWIVGLYFFLMLKIKTNDNKYKLIYLVVAVLNLFYSVPTVFLRYGIFVKMILVLLLLINFKDKLNRKFSFFFICTFLMIQITNLIIMRNNIAVSFSSDTFFLYDILMQKPMRSNRTL